MTAADQTTGQPIELDQSSQPPPSSESLSTFDTLLYTFAGVGVWTFVSMVWPLFSNPMMTWSVITGTPYNFDHAIRSIELETIPRDEVKTTQPREPLTIAAGVVVSEDAIRAYDLGPTIEVDGVPDLDYPRDELEIELWDYNLHSDHKSGQLIDPLLDWLSDRAHTIKTLLGRDVELRVLIAVDKAAGFEIERKIMYTAGQAQHVDIVKVVDSPDGIRMKSNSFPTIGPPAADGDAANGTAPPVDALLDALFATPKSTSSPFGNRRTKKSSADAETPTDKGDAP